jgi:uncharacterized cupin superfamily protein
MPKVDVAAIRAEERTVYPPPYAAIVKGRLKKKLGDAAGLTQFGVNLTRLKPGAASSHRHWHENEDEFVFILEGEAMLVEDGSETRLVAGDAAAFKAGVAIGHHIVNRSARDVAYLEIGARSTNDDVTYTDPLVDMQVSKDAGRWIARRRNGEPLELPKK